MIEINYKDIDYTMKSGILESTKTKRFNYCNADMGEKTIIMVYQKKGGEE